MAYLVINNDLMLERLMNFCSAFVIHMVNKVNNSVVSLSEVERDLNYEKSLKSIDCARLNNLLRFKIILYINL